MEPNYIIFADEQHGDHFYFKQGHNNCISLNPEGSNSVYVDPVVLEETVNSKKRIFTHNKTRYIVVARGRTYEP